MAIILTSFGIVESLGNFYSATGESMLPTITPNSVVYVESLSKHFVRYKKGDIVIVKSLNDLHTTICKRILYTEGDEFTLKNGRTVKLSKGQLWIEGDNKDNSFDSRNFGPVSDYLVLGKVKFSLFPLRKY